MSADDEHHAAWSSALDELEAAVDDAIVASLSPSAPVGQGPALGVWVPAELTGPVPAELLERAQRIHDRQRVALVHLSGELATLRRHRSAVGSVRAATQPQQASVYVDITG